MRNYGNSYYIVNGIWIGIATLKNILALLSKGCHGQAPRSINSNYWLENTRNAFSESLFIRPIKPWLQMCAREHIQNQYGKIVHKSENWKQSQSPSTAEWRDTLWYISFFFPFFTVFFPLLFIPLISPPSLHSNRPTLVLVPESFILFAPSLHLTPHRCHPALCESVSFCLFAQFVH